VLGAVVLAIPLVVLAIAAWDYRWMSDDGFINLRIVSQIKAGHGPVFNAGERVEASTSPLWVAALLVGDLLAPLRLEWVAVLGGLFLTLGGLALALAGSIRLQRGIVERAFWLPVGALVFAAFPPVWRFTTSGLENGLTYAWLGACVFLLATWSRGDGELPVWHAAVLGLGPLVRPELLILSVAFVGLVMGVEWRRNAWRHKVALVAVAFALPVAYEIFRMGYYGSLVPNSAIAKESSRSYWSFGRNYLREAVVDAYALWIPLAILLLGAYVPLAVFQRRAGRRRALLVTAVCLVGGLALATYIVRVGGDFMHARLLLPALFVLLAPVAAVPVRKAFLGAVLVVPWALLVIVALRFPGEKTGIYGAKDPNTILAGVVVGPDFATHIAEPGVYVEGSKLPGTPRDRTSANAIYGVGVQSYAAGPDAYILDLLGLGDAFTSHLRLDRRTIVGHEKPLPQPWIAARLLEPGSSVRAADFPRPDVLIIPIDDPNGQPFVDRVADARRALDCPRIREFVATYRAPMDAGRFLDNLGAAFTNFGFRIPPEPRDAVKKFCPG
jgi:arabinofuranosyltransferase